MTPPPVACRRGAISAARRARYDELAALLRKSLYDRRAVTGGYVFHVETVRMSLQEVAEWMDLERLCCPFLVMEVAVSDDRRNPTLRLTGPEGTKTLLEAEFPVYFSGGGTIK